MVEDDSYIKKRLSAGTIIAPIITLTVLFVFWRLGQKWVIFPAIVFLLFYYLVVPRLVRNRATHFHREALKLLTTGKANKVPDLARKQFLLQLFAPSAPIDAKLGLAYSQIGEHVAAVSHLRNAMDSAPSSERPALQAALAKGLLVTGDLAGAEAEARALVQNESRIPETLAIMARARVGLGKIDSTTQSYIDEARSTAPNDDVRLMADLTEIEAAMARGDKPRKIPEGADSKTRFLRVWINVVRGRLRERKGDPDAAKESYARAVKEGGEEHCWFADVAMDRLNRLSAVGKNPAGNRPAAGPQDPTRKKRKGRRR